MAEQHTRIWREPIVGWVVIVERNPDGTGFVRCEPLAIDQDGLLDQQDEIDLPTGSSINGVLPAAPGTFKVWLCRANEKYFRSVGFEFPGVDNPDWIAEDCGKEASADAPR